MVKLRSNREVLSSFLLIVAGIVLFQLAMGGNQEKLMMYCYGFGLGAGTILTSRR